MKDFWCFKKGAILSYNLHRKPCPARPCYLSPNAEWAKPGPLNQAIIDSLEEGPLFQSVHHIYTGSSGGVVAPSSNTQGRSLVELLESYPPLSLIKRNEDKKLVILVRVHNLVYLFEFIGRNENKLSPLRSDSESEHFINDTCVEIAHELCRPPVPVDKT
jgi:hypothetical protein